MFIKINLKKTLLYFLLITNPILALAFGNTEIYYHYITLPIISFLIFSITFKKRNMYFLYLLLFTILINILFLIILGAEIGKINNHLFCYIDFVLLCVFFYNNKEIKNLYNWLKKHIKVLIAIIIAINIIEAYMFLSKKGFVFMYNWGGTFFVGTSKMPHTLAYLMIITIVLTFIASIIKNKRVILLLSILPFLLIFLSGARITLLMALPLAIIFIDLFFSTKKTSTIVKIIKALLIFSIFIFIFKDQILSSSLFDKITKRKDSGNDSAGRYELWEFLITKYKSTPSKWLFGFGDDKVYYYSKFINSINLNIWAHNDFIQVLFGKGILGILCYLYALKKYIMCLLKNNKSYYSILFIFIFFSAAIFNGFYNYREIMLGIPFIFLLNILLSKKGEIADDK